jgi:ubiquinone/menaquinone biosynthesis C-methylase UbiE
MVDSRDIAARMREDWNARAKEDAHYYVAFGRRNQDDAEFFETGNDQVRGLVQELKRLPPAPVASRKALEIGCGPGRLMKPMSRHFGEIHGVDISDEMIGRARGNLQGVPNAYPRHAPNSNLEAFADASFDFIYSYAVFQHIPSRDVVVGYLRDAARVLKPGGVIRVQINGLPEAAKSYDTWSGVRIPATDVAALARELGLALLALEGAGTQYMWTTWQKPAGHTNPAQQVRIRRITNAHSSEPVAPVRGRFAALSFWMEGLPPEPDLNHISVRVGGSSAPPAYLGPPEADGMRQLNVLLPEGLSSGLAPVELTAHGIEAPRAFVRLITPPPLVPRVMSVSDGIDLMSGARIVTGTLKATIEEVENPERLRVRVGGREVDKLDHFCTDPRLPRWEVNFDLPGGMEGGSSVVEIWLGDRALGRFPIEVVRS